MWCKARLGSPNSLPCAPGASLTEAFDASGLAQRFRYGELSGESAAAVTEARRLAVLSERPRVLTWAVKKKQLTVRYAQESG